MKIRNFFPVICVLSAMILAACAGTNGTGSSCPILGSKALIGSVGGAAAGAGLGAAFSGGSAKGTLIGTGAGLLAGLIAGAILDHQDCAKAQAALKQMDTARSGEKIAWSNPTSGNRGTFTPLTEPKKTKDGRLCRQYKRDVVLKSGEQTAGDVGVVCRNANGDWEVVDHTAIGGAG